MIRPMEPEQTPPRSDGTKKPYTRPELHSYGILAQKTSTVGATGSSDGASPQDEGQNRTRP
jgi:hypothetical protein